MRRNKVGRPKGYRLSQQSKDQIAASKRGTHHTQETKNKIQATLLGKNNSANELNQGGKFIDRRGYVLQYTGNGVYVREHRLVIEKEIGRKLQSDEIIHHLDGKKDHNDRKNLLLCTIQEHMRVHGWMRQNGITGIRYGTPNYLRLLNEVLFIDWTSSEAL